MWLCPICQHSLSQSARSFCCENRHSFDLAKEGYLNLLPVNKKRSKQPGDSKEMIAARRQIHLKEVYKPLAQALISQLTQLNPEAFLEIGCGEGYYSAALADEFSDATGYGIDISKEAVRLAAKANKQLSFAVASSYQVPLADDSLDLIVRIFAPSEANEILRLLKGEGVFCVVSPAANHLIQIRKALYDSVQLHSDEVAEFEGLHLHQRHQLVYQVTLDNETLNQLIQMTPFAHKGHPQKRQTLLSQLSLEVDMAFHIDLYTKSDGSAA